MKNVIQLGINPNAAQIDAGGFLATAQCATEELPAVIVNAAASDASLAAWCAGEVKALRTIADLMGAGPAGEIEQFTHEDIGALFGHRLGPLERVLTHLAQRMSANQDA